MSKGVYIGDGRTLHDVLCGFFVISLTTDCFGRTVTWRRGSECYTFDDLLMCVGVGS